MLKLRKKSFKSEFIEKHGVKGWIRLSGHEVVFPVNTSLDDIVNGLIHLREDMGLKSYYTIYEGHYLYSLDVTMENAYLEVYGKSYEEVKVKRTLKQK